MMPAGPIRAITLWQPYAEMVRLGLKKIETRSWRPPAAAVGQPLAIHAAASDHMNGKHARSLVPARRLIRHDEPLALGAVVATCTITEVFKIERSTPWFGGRRDRIFVEGWSTADPGACVGYEVRAETGDFELGRWMWVLRDIEPLDEPVPAKGRQGLWWWTP